MTTSDIVALAATRGAAAAARPALPKARFGDHRLDPVVLAAATVALVLPVATVVSALGRPWIGTSDWAAIEETVRHVGGAGTTLVGARSRYGWHHPGPWPFYLLTPLYRLVPARYGLTFATALYNLLMVGAFVVVAARYERARALVALLGLVVLERGLGAALLVDVWNPNLALLPFAVYLLLCVELAIDAPTWALPAAVATASLAIQAHAALALPVALTALTTATLRHRARPGRRLGWRAAGVVGAVAWVPPVVDQVVGDGNLGQLVRWSFGHDVTAPGPWDSGHLPAGDVVAGAAWLLDPAGVWAGRFSAPAVGPVTMLGQSSSWRLVLTAALLAAPPLLLRRAPDGPPRDAARAAWWLGLTGVAAIFLALKTNRGLPFLWALRWSAPVMMLAAVALGWAILAVVPGRLDGRVAGATALLVVAIPMALAVGKGSLGRFPSQAESEQWRRFEPRILRALDGEDLVVADPGPLAYGEDDLVFRLLLDRAGITWVTRDDPRAKGRPIYSIKRVPVGNDPDDTQAGHVVAREAAATGTLSPDGLVLVRDDPGGRDGRYDLVAAT